MAHETHSTDKTPKVSYTAGFLLVLILAGLFIAAVNFVNVMGGESEHNGHEKGAVESAHFPREATSGGYLKGEGARGVKTKDTVQHFPQEAGTENHSPEGH